VCVINAGYLSGTYLTRGCSLAGTPLSKVQHTMPARSHVMSSREVACRSPDSVVSAGEAEASAPGNIRVLDNFTRMEEDQGCV